ncbi:hypothetical protein MMC11_002820 [Xylographa trunciseda]|nr:hypothetical protein [Xylographa trunciseda]
MKPCVVLAALPVLLPPLAFAFPSTYPSSNILTYRGLPHPSDVVPGAFQIGARQPNPYPCAGACSHAATDTHPPALFSTDPPERDLAVRAVSEILQRAASAATPARHLSARNALLGLSAAHAAELGHAVKAGAKAAGQYVKSPTNDLGLAGDVLSVLPVPGVEEAGLAIKGVSVAAKAEKAGKAAAYASKGLKAAHRVNDAVGKAQDVVGRVQDVQSRVQTAQQVVGQVRQGMQKGKEGGKGKGQGRKSRRAFDEEGLDWYGY